MNTWKKSKLDLSENDRRIVNVISASTIAIPGVADGKNLPVLFLDTQDRQDIDHAIMQQSEEMPGDVLTTWTRFSKYDYKTMLLVIRLTKPIECNFILKFELLRLAHIVDLIVRNQGCYIQSSKGGITLFQSHDYPKLMIEVKSNHIADEWERIYQLSMTNRFKKSKVKPKKASEMASEFIKEMRMMDFRL